MDKINEVKKNRKTRRITCMESTCICSFSGKLDF